MCYGNCSSSQQLCLQCDDMCHMNVLRRWTTTTTLYYYVLQWILLEGTLDTMYYYVYYVIQCITMLYSVLQWSTMEYNGLRPWGHSPLFFKRKEKENGGRKKNFHVKNVFGVNACREEYALHPYHISPIFI